MQNNVCKIHEVFAEKSKKPLLQAEITLRVNKNKYSACNNHRGKGHPIAYFDPNKVVFRF